jgi:hypothetical protein
MQNLEDMYIIHNKSPQNRKKTLRPQKLNFSLIADKFHLISIINRQIPPNSPIIRQMRSFWICRFMIEIRWNLSAIREKLSFWGRRVFFRFWGLLLWMMYMSSRFCIRATLWVLKVKKWPSKSVKLNRTWLRRSLIVTSIPWNVSLIFLIKTSKSRHPFSR